MSLTTTVQHSDNDDLSNVQTLSQIHHPPVVTDSVRTGSGFGAGSGPCGHGVHVAVHGQTGVVTVYSTALSTHRTERQIPWNNRVKIRLQYRIIRISIAIQVRSVVRHTPEQRVAASTVTVTYVAVQILRKIHKVPS